MRRKYILWDHDGVLVETEPWYFKANQIALLELGITITRDEYMYYMQTGNSVWSLAEKKGINKDCIAEKRIKRNAYYQEFLKTKDIEIPNVTAVLKDLKQYFSMAIITTSKKDDFELIHKNRTILKYMDFYLTNGDYEHSKPQPDPYLTAMKRFNAAPEECVVIEDSARGLKSAIAAGIECVIVKNEFTKTHNFTGALTIVDSLQDIKEIIL
jgi:HAD superfamily hydrolase (TIGR01509 family)